ncbi:hypothetical protein [Hymenobacter sp. 102]|uniref:hypothetical protein n=1 Tax=Hymenobacter sp. 102 TaxID=3403152 RepID=UPI003CEED247
MTATDALASLGITPAHPGPFTYDELVQVAEAALALPVEEYSPESITREQLKGRAFLMAPATTTPLPHHTPQPGPDGYYPPF